MINPDANVPAPVNPNAGAISNFKYANTNDNLPKSTSMSQFNKEIEERNQYQLNNPNANSRRRTHNQAFDDYPDLYSERENYPSLNNIVKEPNNTQGRNRRISDDESEEEEEEKQIEEKVNITKFFKPSDYGTPNTKNEEPTPMWMKRDEKLEQKKKEEAEGYKKFDSNILRKMAEEPIPSYNNRRPHQDNYDPPAPGPSSTNNIYFPERKRKKSSRYSDEEDDKFYGKKARREVKSQTGNRDLDQAYSGKGFVNADVSYHHEMHKKYGNNYDNLQNYRQDPRGYDQYGNCPESATSKLMNNNGRQPGLGRGRRFNPPMRNDDGNYGYNPGKSIVKSMNGNSGGMQQKGEGSEQYNYKIVDEDGNPHPGYSSLDPRMVEIIENEILEDKHKVTWDDIAGLEFCKKTIREVIILPMIRPDIFVGIRAPPKGALLFGPPGTGKTMIGKAIAAQSKSTFFNISASALTSKWIGEGEKLVKTLFKLSVIHQPSVIFIDEIDSLLCSRSDNENEAGRKIKTEFMVHIGGAGTDDTDKVLIIGATNRPYELDEAVRRRLERRLYVPLPTKEGRNQFLTRLIEKEKEKTKIDINEQEIDKLVQLTKGYSGADLDTLCREAAMFPVREQVEAGNFETASAD